MTHSNTSDNNAWGRASDTAPAAAAPAPKKRRGLKILVTVVVVIVLLLAVAEFGLRTYLKGQVADEMRSSASEQGIELSGDPDVSFGASPLLLGLVQQKVPELTVDLPSSLEISYEDSDRSKPVVNGQPAATITAKDMEITGDDPTAGDLTLDTTLPQDYLLAIVQQSSTDGTATDSTEGAADEGGTSDLLSGLIQITGVTPNEETGTLDIDISGGLATLSMTPTVADGALSFEVADLKIFGMSLPDDMVAGLTDSLTKSVEKTENLDITDASVTADGLKVRMHGTDVRLDDIASEVDDATSSATGGSTGSSTAQSGEAAA